MYEFGDRVVAMKYATAGRCYVFGYGIYLGEEVPPKGIQFMDMDAHDFGSKEAKILLDSGKIVWGCECFWGSEEISKRNTANDEIIFVDIYEERAKSKKK